MKTARSAEGELMTKLKSDNEESGRGVYVPARWIPAPKTVSQHAHDLLANPPQMGMAYPPDPHDKASWESFCEEGNQFLTHMLAESAAKHPCEVTEHRVGDTTLYDILPPNVSAEDSQRAIYYVHGGAFIHGSGLCAAYMAQPLAATVGLRVLSIDYRMPPAHPFPIGLEDALLGYRAALERFAPEQLAVVGPSAGGGLAGSLVLKIRDSGLPMPAACVLATPEADLTESGDSFETNAEVDVILRKRLSESIALYAGGHDLRDPYLSPVFGDFSKGFPPTILLSGTRDLFLSNTVRLHRALRKAGVEADLHVWEAMPHGGFYGAPEDTEVLVEQARFVRKHLGATEMGR
jgi:epsilon-lactone hydrolase